jgi:succinyl-diaminopimelate desuccinylase
MMEPGRHHGAGPRTIEEANARRADERLPLDDPREATEVLALTLLDPLAPGAAWG